MKRDINLWERTAKSGTRYWRWHDKETGESFTLFHNESSRNNPDKPTFKLIHEKDEGQQAPEQQQAISDEDVPF